jgi:hypothetical protein
MLAGHSRISLRLLTDADGCWRKTQEDMADARRASSSKSLQLEDMLVLSEREREREVPLYDIYYIRHNIYTCDMYYIRYIFNLASLHATVHCYILLHMCCILLYMYFAAVSGVLMLREQVPL